MPVCVNAAQSTAWDLIGRGEHQQKQRVRKESREAKTPEKGWYRVHIENVYTCRCVNIHVSNADNKKIGSQLKTKYVNESAWEVVARARRKRIKYSSLKSRKRTGEEGGKGEALSRAPCRRGKKKTQAKGGPSPVSMWIRSKRFRSELSREGGGESPGVPPAPAVSFLHVAGEMRKMGRGRRRGGLWRRTGLMGSPFPFPFFFFSFLHSFLTDTVLVDGLGTRDSDSGTVFWFDRLSCLHLDLGWDCHPFIFVIPPSFFFLSSCTCVSLPPTGFFIFTSVLPLLSLFSPPSLLTYYLLSSFLLFLISGLPSTLIPRLIHTIHDTRYTKGGKKARKEETENRRTGENEGETVGYIADRVIEGEKDIYN